MFQDFFKYEYYKYVWPDFLNFDGYIEILIVYFRYDNFGVMADGIRIWNKY